MFMEEAKYLPITKLLPNAITMLSLCSGLTAIKLALSTQFERAVLFIVIAAILDILDGRFARMLNAQSKIGAQLDSLCDFINFGFAPIFIMYLWSFKDIKILGWSAVLVVTVCTCIRLARFNASEEERTEDVIKSYFFEGIPSPAGGLLILTPLILSFDFLNSPIVVSPNILAIYSIIIALLMVSTIPTLSTKKIKIKSTMIPQFMVIMSLVIIFAFTYGWLAMVLASSLYILSIPYTYLKYKRMQKKHKNS